MLYCCGTDCGIAAIHVLWLLFATIYMYCGYCLQQYTCIVANVYSVYIKVLTCHSHGRFEVAERCVARL